jgi:hypothetical protein
MLPWRRWLVYLLLLRTGKHQRACVLESLAPVCLGRLLTPIARVLTINNLIRVTPAVVEVARDSLVIGTA